MFDLISNFIDYSGSVDLTEVIAAGSVLVLLTFILVGSELITRFIDIFKRIK